MLPVASPVAFHVVSPAVRVASPMSSRVAHQNEVRPLRQPSVRLVASDDVEFVALGAATAQILLSLATKVVASNRD
jgi:hypothetical protein